MKLVFATGNSGKLREASEILGEGFELVTPAQEGITEEIPETGNTLRANSLQKAKYIFDHTVGGLLRGRHRTGSGHSQGRSRCLFSQIRRTIQKFRGEHGQAPERDGFT